MQDCIFCKIIKKEIPADILYEDNDVVVFKDIKPKAPIHWLVVPRKHLDSISEISDDDSALMGKIVYRAKEIAATQGLAERGYKLVFNCGPDGGQVVYHIHLHVLGGKRLEE